MALRTAWQKFLSRGSTHLKSFRSVLIFVGQSITWGCTSYTPGLSRSLTMLSRGPQLHLLSGLGASDSVVLREKEAEFWDESLGQTNFPNIFIKNNNSNSLCSIWLSIYLPDSSLSAVCSLWLSSLLLWLHSVSALSSSSLLFTYVSSFLLWCLSHHEVYRTWFGVRTGY